MGPASAQIIIIIIMLFSIPAELKQAGVVARLQMATTPSCSHPLCQSSRHNPLWRCLRRSFLPVSAKPLSSVLHVQLTATHGTRKTNLITVAVVSKGRRQDWTLTSTTVTRPRVERLPSAANLRDRVVPVPRFASFELQNANCETVVRSH